MSAFVVEPRVPPERVGGGPAGGVHTGAGGCGSWVMETGRACGSRSCCMLLLLLLSLLGLFLLLLLLARFDKVRDSGTESTVVRVICKMK